MTTHIEQGPYRVSKDTTKIVALDDLLRIERIAYTLVDGDRTIEDGDAFDSDGKVDGTLTLSDNLMVENGGDLLLNVDGMGNLAGDKTITIKPQGKIKLKKGRKVTVLDGTKGKIHT